MAQISWRAIAGVFDRGATPTTVAGLSSCRRPTQPPPTCRGGPLPRSWPRRSFCPSPPRSSPCRWSASAKPAAPWQPPPGPKPSPATSSLATTTRPGRTNTGPATGDQLAQRSNPWATPNGRRAGVTVRHPAQKSAHQPTPQPCRPGKAPRAAADFSNGQRPRDELAVLSRHPESCPWPTQNWPPSLSGDLIDARLRRAA